MKSNPRKWLLAASLSALSIVATGCSSARNSASLPPSTQTLDQSVNITDACVKLGTVVPHPAMRVGDDMEIVVMRYAAALEEANATIGAKDGCTRQLVARYRATGTVGER